ncbi:Rid family hydrolase [Bradyrhizobium sp. dw_411]|uniref:RidA family protein n=1 Tax=Bradyrhizobium sp. dw_411 TaxID=2720082 RepID=UPI001BCC8EB5|nr:Rid family hydrolase [Bradyrhizobium sp. dw_411]
MPKKVIYTDRLMRPIAHFSHASRIGNLVHVGATAGVYPDLRLAGDSPGRIDVGAQTRKMFDNLDTALGLIDATLSDVVRIKTYVAFPRDIATYLPIYEQRFSSIRPAHTVIGSWDFPLPQAAIELDAVAVTGGGNRSIDAASMHSRVGSAMAGVLADGFHYATALPIDGEGQTVAQGCRIQTAAALRNLRTMLAAAELDPHEVCNIHLTLRDIREHAEVCSMLEEFFGGKLPTCTIVGAPLERPDFSVSIESIAIKGGGECISTPLAPSRPGHPAPAMLAGDVLFLSGQTGLKEEQDYPDVRMQTDTAWARLHGLIEAAGFDSDSMIRTNNVLTDWRDYAGFNAGYGGNMREPFVPRATVLGYLDLPSARVQIEGIAHRHGADATILQVPPPAG